MKKRFMLLAMSAMLCIGGGGQALASEKFVNLQGESLEGGIVPYFNAIIWLIPHGSKRDGIKNRSLPA